MTAWHASAQTPQAPAVADTPAIAVENLVRRYGRTPALRGLSFSVPTGALCGLIGPNGAGKTTLLSILATLDENFGGEAHVGGASVRHDPFGVRRIVGFVPDHAPLYEAMTGLELLEFFARASALPAASRRRAVERVVADCGIASYLDRPAAGLSKGQAQRLCVARALLHEPAVLLLDEPASGLDPRARIELKELLKKLGDGGTTVLVSSHILTELGDFCDHVVVVEQGRAVAAGTIDSLAAAHGGRTQDAPRRLVVEVDRDGDLAANIVRAQSEVGEVFVDGNVLSVLLRGPRAKNAQIASALFAAGFGIVQLVPERVSLEALFLTVTKGGAA